MINGTVLGQNQKKIPSCVMMHPFMLPNYYYYYLIIWYLIYNHITFFIRISKITAVFTPT